MILSITTLLLIAQAMALTACAQSAHQSGQARLDKLVPADLRQQIDRSVSFSELQAHPEQYEGKIVMLGGAVLSAKRLQDRTEIEILELPLTEALVPMGDRMRSRGRFFAVKTEFLDPATVRTGSLITVTGKMMGTFERPLDETMYRYPAVEILHLINWEKSDLPYEYSRAMPYPYLGDYYGPFYGGYGGFYGRYAPYYGGYYPYPYYFGPLVAPPPPNPPPAGVPPQFKK